MDPKSWIRWEVLTTRAAEKMATLTDPRDLDKIRDYFTVTKPFPTKYKVELDLAYEAAVKRLGK